VILPIALISTSSFFKIVKGTVIEQSLGSDTFAALARIAFFIGHKNIALSIGTVIALWVLARQLHLSFMKLEKLMGPPLETAGMIILITAAGGAFGGMLRNAGVGDAIGELAKTYSIPLLLLAWLTAAVIRIAQGSATVAMLTTSGIVWQIIMPKAAVAPEELTKVMGMQLGFHPMYIFLAIAFGSFCCSWMNDSGFWVVSRLSGMTEKETLKSWTVMLTVTSIFGLIQVLVLSKLLPLI